MSHRIDPHDGPIKLFLVPASAPQLVYQRQWYVLSCLWDGAYKRISMNSPCSGGSGFPLSLSGPLPYVQCHITINKMC